MSTLAEIVQDLESLPPEKLEEAAHFIQGLKEDARSRKKAILDRTFSRVNAGDADRVARAIEEGCEQIDANGWQ